MKTDNWLIAEFMGRMCFKTYEEMQAVPLDVLTEWEIPDDPKWGRQYQNDWNKLMPVVEKIESDPLMDVCIFKEATQIRKWDGGKEIFEWKILEPDGSSKIAHVYRAVVQTIKRYNSQNKS